ncbi:hypothetical protein H0H93_011113 [Arthromyces matolae]|nr:hypothetical protein H0H93_011113 [Arthromyces matolae]
MGPAKVVIGDLDTVGAERTVHDIEVVGGVAVSQKCNVTIWDDQVALFELAIAKFGVVDIVVPNAGVPELGQFQQVSFKDGKPLKPDTRTIDVNLFGLIYSTHLAQHYLDVKREPNDDGLKAIVLIGSVASWVGIPRGAMYAASKHAVLGIMRSLYPEFKFKNIRIATIHPFFAGNSFLEFLQVAPNYPIDTNMVPIPIKLFLAGIPLVPVARIAGAIIHAATNPDPETNGAAFLLNDDGPVFMVPREEFKLGVYKMVDARSNMLLRGAAGVAFYTRFIKDSVRILGKPALITVAAATAAKVSWDNRELILDCVHKYVSLG